MVSFRTKNKFSYEWIDEDNVASEAVEDETGDGSIPRQAVLLLCVHGLFAVANALSGTFVHVYLWKASESYVLIGSFTLANQLANVSTFLLAGKWVKQYNKMNSLRLGVGISAVFYLLVLYLKTNAIHYVWVLGAVQGMAMGFFWLAFNVVYFEITDAENRDKFNGWSGLLGSGAGMIAPWISGILITRMKETSGYTLIFSISLFVFIVAAVFSFFLKKRKVQKHYDGRYAFRKLREKHNLWRSAFPALATQGIREGVFAFVIGLLVYISTGNELKLGNYALITSGIGLVSFWLVGKMLKPRFRSRAMGIGVVFMVLVLLPFWWDINYTTLLIFGIGTSLFFPLFNIPMTSTVFDIIGIDQDSADHRVEYVVFRELGLNIGRIFGTTMFIFVMLLFGKHTMALTTFIIAVGCTAFLPWLFMRRVDKQLHVNR